MKKKGNDVDTPIEAQYDPWGQSVLNALRRWIIIPIALGLVGAAAGLVAASMAQPSAEAMLRVESAATDGTGMQIVQESTMLELNTAPVYNAAAEVAGTTPADLRTRTQIAAVPDSQLITITVTAPTSEEAVAQANAIADTAIKANDDRIDAELGQVTEATRELIADNKLADADAEESRVSRLGDSLGLNQSNLVVGSRNLVLLQSAEAASLLPSPPLLGALGLVAGGLLGAVIALLLGARRGSIQSVQEVHRLYPNASVVDRLDLETVITLESQNASVVYIAAIGESQQELEPLADAVRTQFLANGRDVDGYDPHRMVKVAERTGQLQIITTTLSDTVLRRVERDSSSLLIVPVQPKVTRMEQLDTFAPRLNDRTYLLVQPGTSNWS